jgi:hypothetical protein
MLILRCKHILDVVKRTGINDKLLKEVETPARESITFRHGMEGVNIDETVLDVGNALTRIC